MTEQELRSKVVATAKSFLGYSEAAGSHKKIIDIYNAHEPLAVGYKVKYTDEWCATFGSVVAIQTGLTSIIPTECSCPRQIELWKKKNRWEEDDNYLPQPGDYIYYNWNDPKPSTDNIGPAAHVGIVYAVAGSQIQVIEGNYKNSVAIRTITRNAQYIRGYGRPDYASVASSGIEYITKPKKIAIFVNSKGITKEQVKAQTGCTALINGGLFEWTVKSGYKPCCLLKVDGQVLSNDGYKYRGIGWNKDGEGLTMSTDMAAFANYISCVAMVYNFKPESMIYNSAMAGSRQRTALGIMDDGSIWMYMTLKGTTPEELQQIALNAGCKYALMLDGGASTQGITPSGTISSNTRPVVQNYICIWDEKAVIESPECPYAEPKVTLRKGSTGEGVMWLQWMLNQYGAKLTVDGDFGVNTYVAVNAFQFKYGLERDGIAGPMTIAELKENLNKAPVIAPIEDKPDICPYKEPTTNVTYGTKGENAKWVQWMLNHHGNSLDVDGDFGAKSYEALLRFQRSVGLNLDGICGAVTRSKLKEDI